MGGPGPQVGRTGRAEDEVSVGGSVAKLVGIRPVISGLPVQNSSSLGSVSV